MNEFGFKAVAAVVMHFDGTLPAGAVCLLQALGSRGVKLYLAGAGTSANARQIGVAAYFAKMFEAGNALSQLCAENGLPKETTACIADTAEVVAQASQLGLRAIGVGAAVDAELSVVDFTDVPAVLERLGYVTNPPMDFSGLKTYSASGRHNLVTVDGLVKPETAPESQWTADGFEELVERIVIARVNGRPVMFSIGAHVIKNNLSLFLIDMMRRGIITHYSGNGACSIHDFELAYLGGTSEHVPTAIEDGSFGMWEETGRWMNEAIQEGVAAGYGYGESLARYIHRNPEKFPYKDACVLYQAWLCGVPATYHVALGTDIIHQHPICDFGAIGTASGRDFHTYCHSLSQLDGGVFLNFGSGVIGPEVFLKALSISRNLGCQTFRITTANFDLIDLGDYRCKIGYEDPHYYYRPRKNIVNRPVSCGGKGWHFVGDHQETIPALWQALRRRGL